LVNDAEKGGLINGGQVCRQAPSITHLFFVDDSILVTRETMREVECIADILQLYEKPLVSK
jgi:hypothetical protein